MTDLLLRRVSKSRAGADGPDDYDVAGPDGLVVGRIFKANTSPVGTPWIVDGELRFPRRPHPDTRRPGNTRGGDGGVREKLAEGVSHDRAGADHGSRAHCRLAASKRAGKAAPINEQRLCFTRLH